MTKTPAKTAITKAVARLSAPGKPTIPLALAQFDQLPDAAWVRLPTVAALRNTGPASVWRHSKLGLIPMPVKLSAGVTAWNVGALRRAMAAQVGA
jgi:predicted DNA-binding transcriptional regulator AlpA